MLAGTVLVFLPAVGDFVSAQLLGGPDTYMVGNLIQQQFLGAENWPFGAALTTVMMAFLAIWMVLYLRSAARAAREATRRERRAPKDFDRPRFLRVFTALFFVFMFAPIALVALFSFNSTPLAPELRGLQPPVVRALLRERVAARLAHRQHPDRVRDDGGGHRARHDCSRYGLVRARTRWAGSANVLMLIPLVTPEIVAGVSALLLFTQIGMQLSLTTIMLAHITFSISYVTVVVRARLAALEPGGRAGGAGPRRHALQTLRLVTLPELWPAILAAGPARVRAQLRRLRDLVLHHRRVAAAAAGADLLGDPLRRDARRSTRSARSCSRLAAPIGLAIALPRLLGRRESGLGVLVGREAA